MITRTKAVWVALRVLHEKYGAPFDLLAPAGKVSPRTVESRARKEHWIKAETGDVFARRHHRRALQIERLERQIERMISEMEAGGSEFDKARIDMIGALLRATEKLRETVPAEAVDEEEGQDRDERMRVVLERINERILTLAHDFAGELVKGGDRGGCAADRG